MLKAFQKLGDLNSNQESSANKESPNDLFGKKLFGQEHRRNSR